MARASAESGERGKRSALVIFLRTQLPEKIKIVLEQISTGKQYAPPYFF